MSLIFFVKNFTKDKISSFIATYHTPTTQVEGSRVKRVLDDATPDEIKHARKRLICN